MIRDPSDGSVREHTGPICKGCGMEFYYDFVPRPNDSSGYCENCFERPKPTDGNTTVIDTTTSGLPSASAKDADRHKRSKEWLAGYRSGYPYFCTDCDEGRSKLTEDGRCTMCHGARIITIAGKIKSEEKP